MGVRLSGLDYIRLVFLSIVHSRRHHESGQYVHAESGPAWLSTCIRHPRLIALG